MRRVKQVLSVLVAVVVLFVALPFSASALSTVTSGKYRVSIATKQGFAAGGVTKIAATGVSFTVPASGPYVIKLSSGFFSLGGAYSPSYELYTMEGGKKTVLATQEAGGDASGVAGSWEHSISAGTLNKGQKYYMSFSLSIAGVLNFASLDCYAESVFAAEEYSQDGQLVNLLYDKSFSNADTSIYFEDTLYATVERPGYYDIIVKITGNADTYTINKSNYGDERFEYVPREQPEENANYTFLSYLSTTNGANVAFDGSSNSRYSLADGDDPYTLLLSKNQPLNNERRYRFKFKLHLSTAKQKPVFYGNVQVFYRLRDAVSVPDLSHQEVTHTSGGESRGGGAGRRDWYTVEYPDPEDPTKTIRKDTGELNILDEANKTVNLVTSSGNETYTYTNSSYNPTTNTTTVTTTTGDRITITSEENQVYVSKTDNSGNTTIYNYYYTSPEGGSGGGSGGGGGSEGGGGSDGGFSWDWLWDLIKGVGSFLLNLIGTLGSLLGDALSAVTGLFDFIGSFVGFIGGAFSFIPAEIWTLIGAGIAVSIVLRFLKR